MTRFLIILLILVLNCYDAKKENPNVPLNALVYSIILNPFPSPFIFFQSLDLPGTTIAVKKFSNTYYALIEDPANTNLITLYLSTNGLDFSTTGQTIDISSLTSLTFGDRTFISHNSILYYGKFSSYEGNNYSYYSYSNNSWSSLQSNQLSLGLAANHDLRCFYSINNQLYTIVASQNNNIGSNAIFNINLQSNTFTNLSNSPNFSGPRQGFGCSNIDSSLYFFGGSRFNCTSGTCSFTDLWMSSDGLTFSRISNNLPSSFFSISSSILKFNNGSLVSFGIGSVIKSTDGGVNWISSLVITGQSSPINSGFTETDGTRLFIYSGSKVYYGTIP